MIQSELGKLLQWLQGMRYRDIRVAESVQAVEVTIGSSSKPLRGVSVAKDLVLGRDRQFYRIFDGHAVVMPLANVIEQYSLKEIMSGYAAARKTQPRSRR